MASRPIHSSPTRSQRILMGPGRDAGLAAGTHCNQPVVLTLPQRLCYLASALTYFDGWQKAVYVSAAVICSRDWHFAAGSAGSGASPRDSCPGICCLSGHVKNSAVDITRSWVIEQYNFLRSPAFIFCDFDVLPEPKTSFQSHQQEHMLFHPRRHSAHGAFETRGHPRHRNWFSGRWLRFGLSWPTTCHLAPCSSILCGALWFWSYRSPR